MWCMAFDHLYTYLVLGVVWKSSWQQTFWKRVSWPVPYYSFNRWLRSRQCYLFKLKQSFMSGLSTACSDCLVAGMNQQNQFWKFFSLALNIYFPIASLRVDSCKLVRCFARSALPKVCVLLGIFKTWPLNCVLWYVGESEHCGPTFSA